MKGERGGKLLWVATARGSPRLPGRPWVTDLRPQSQGSNRGGGPPLGIAPGVSETLPAPQGGPLSRICYFYCLKGQPPRGVPKGRSPNFGMMGCPPPTNGQAFHRPRCGHLRGGDDLIQS